MNLLKRLQSYDKLTVDELEALTEERLNVVSLAAYLQDIDESKRQPASVGRAVVRESRLKSLSASGVMDRKELTNLSYDELNEMWKELPGPKWSDPYPTSYEIVPCYRWILNGVAQYGATKFVARQEGLQALDQDDQMVHEFEGIDQRKALRFIGLADEVLRPYISRFGWDEKSTVLELSLSEEQIAKFRKKVEQKDL